MSVYAAMEQRSIRDGVLRTLMNLRDVIIKTLNDHPYLLEYAEEVRRARLEVAENFDYWIDRSMRVLQERGCNVYFADNAEEARRIAGEIVGSGMTVVKAKSMVSEEIHLREHLQSLGNEVWETDLGEFIVQVAGDRPMHMIVPALHYSESQVMEILKKVGIHGRNAEELAEGVRNFMREKFLKANAGISGCNAFSANTGRIFLVENEGNIRLSTSLPEKYIALVSIEKILPDDILALKSVFVQAAYVGTYPPAYININEKAVNQEMHVIFLDNGRKGTEFREHLACIKCGRCQLECPVFQLAGSIWGGEVYGGPTGMVWTAITEKIPEVCFLSTLCGKCREVCPSDIDMPEMIRKMREIILESQKIK